MGVPCNRILGDWAAGLSLPLPPPRGSSVLGRSSIHSLMRVFHTNFADVDHETDSGNVIAAAAIPLSLHSLVSLVWSRVLWQGIQIIGCQIV